MSSVAGASAGGVGLDDNCARTGFEEPAPRDGSGSRDGGGGGGGGGWSTSRPPFSASGANAGGGKKSGGGGAFSGIGGAQKRKASGGGADDKGRLWKGLCTSGKQKSRR